MNKTTWISLVALFILVLSLPVYGLLESSRMEHAKIKLQDQYVLEGIDIYLQNCASCHATDGSGIGMMPALNNAAFAEARTDLLFSTIARATHGTSMAAWHNEEGGILNDYQIQELVALIQHGDWTMISRMATVRGYSDQTVSVAGEGLAYLAVEDEDDPHQCLDCHEEPEIHAELFGVNCARCHNTVTWKPAVLTKHDFLLDHGGKGEVDCATCHPNNYVEYDCYACHEDHQAPEMETVHISEGLSEYTSCATCHPSGVAGEADLLRNQQPDLYSKYLDPGTVNYVFDENTGYTNDGN